MPNIIKLKINNGTEDVLDTYLSIDESVIKIDDKFLLNILEPLHVERDSIKYF